VCLSCVWFAYIFQKETLCGRFGVSSCGGDLQKVSSISISWGSEGVRVIFASYSISRFKLPDLSFSPLFLIFNL